MDLVHIIALILFARSTVQSAEDKIYCSEMKEKRIAHTFVRTWKQFENDNVFGWAKKLSIEVQIIKCNFFKSSGFTYNNIGRNISDFYKFYKKNDELAVTSESNESEVFSFINHVSFDDNSSLSLFEISFEDGDLQLLPNGINFTFLEVNSLNITNCGLSVLDKENLKQFGGHLKAANFSNNLLTFITADLFNYNENLKFCDFNFNPILYIAEIFFDIKFMRENEMDFKVHELRCSDEKIINYLPTAQSYNSKFSFYSINCSNPENVFNYTDLEKNLRRKAEATEIFCTIRSYCKNFVEMDVNGEWLIDNSNPVAKCNTIVLNPQVFVLKTREFAYKQINGNCKESSNINLEFIDEIMKYIPMKLVEVTMFKVRTMKIINSGLFSINQYDMKQFGDELRFVDFSFNKLKEIGPNVFRYNKHLRGVKLEGNSISYVDSKYLLGDTFTVDRKSNVTYRCGRTM